MSAGKKTFKLSDYPLVRDIALILAINIPLSLAACIVANAFAEPAAAHAVAVQVQAF